MPIKTLKNPPQNLQIIHNYLILPWAAHMAQIWKFMTKIRLRHPLLYQFCTCDSSSHESFFTLREIEFLGHCNRDKSVPVPPENQKNMYLNKSFLKKGKKREIFVRWIERTQGSNQMLKKVISLIHSYLLFKIWTLLHHNAQPVLIFNRENLQNSKSQHDFIALTYPILCPLKLVG